MWSGYVVSITNLEHQPRSISTGQIQLSDKFELKRQTEKRLGPMILAPRVAVASKGGWRLPCESATWRRNDWLKLAVKASDSV